MSRSEYEQLLAGFKELALDAEGRTTLDLRWHCLDEDDIPPEFNEKAGRDSWPAEMTDRLPFDTAERHIVGSLHLPVDSEGPTSTLRPGLVTIPTGSLLEFPPRWTTKSHKVESIGDIFQSLSWHAGVELPTVMKD